MRSDSNEQNGLAELPAELLQLIVSKTLTADAISSLMQTSKLLAEKITASLRNPASLLQIMNNLTASDLLQLVQTHFSPESGNYKAIEIAAKNDNNYKIAATVCFAMITNDIKLLDWAKTIEAITTLAKVNPAQFDNLKNSLMVMKQAAEAETTEAAISAIKNARSNEVIRKAIETLEGKRPTLIFPQQLNKGISYLNLSGLNLNKANIISMCLSAANLRNTSFREARIIDTRMENTLLDGADLSNIELKPSDSYSAISTSFLNILERNDQNTLKIRLDELLKYKLANPESEKIIQGLVLGRILGDVENRIPGGISPDMLEIGDHSPVSVEIVQMAYAHPFFSRHNAQTNSNDFFKPTETESQKMLREAIGKDFTLTPSTKKTPSS